jgi:hypothetical protein
MSIKSILDNNLSDKSSKFRKKCKNMEDELHIGVWKITNAINETFSKLGKNLKSEDAVRRALKSGKLPHIKIDGKYAMYQSWIEKIADQDCTIFGLKGFADHVDLTEDQVKYLTRQGSDYPLNVKWLDEILGTKACNPDSADNFKKMINDRLIEREGKRGRPRKGFYTYEK